MVNTNKVEFDGERARLYEEAIMEYPLARQEDILAMFRLLEPKEGERILGIGEGNGYFCKSISDALGLSGKYTVTDPSKDQLENLKHRVSASNLEINVASAQEIEIQEEFYDKVWSFGAFHHCPNQTEAMRRVYKSLKKGGRAVICDVFQESKLARHFDEQVARYCLTGHEAKFLSEDFAGTLCFLAGFNDSDVEIVNLPQEWKFDSEKDMGRFIYKLHAMTLMAGDENQKIAKTIEGCKRILGVKKVAGGYALNWPMKVLKAEK
jgi:cyclopropane fatty-acyl-phospholipid synthase-like methyltransferase